MEYPMLEQALYARDVASAYYLRNPRVTLIDVGYKITEGVTTDTVAVRVHVRKKPTEATFEIFSVSNPDLVIDKSKIPFMVDIIEATYKIHWWWTPAVVDPRAQACDPLTGGISVSGEWVYGYGTLGGIVEDRVTGEKMILSNWHVLAGSEYGVPGTRIFQPGYGDFGTGDDTVATLTRHVFDQEIDAAVATLNGARRWKNEQPGIGAVTGVTAPDLGMLMTKSGRASGVTHGKIDGFEGEYPVYYHGLMHRIKHVHRIVPQPGESNVSIPGDSGSWWLKEGSREAVGLHFAGQDDPDVALAMAMPQVLDALNVNIAGIQPAAVIQPAAIVQPAAEEQPAAAVAPIPAPEAAPVLALAGR